MELRHLRYFKAVAELLNFSRAAEKMRVAQPALSRQIRALEEEVGRQLFERDRGVRLTDAGRTFYAHTCKILAQVDMAVASVHAPRDPGGGELIVCNDWRLSGQFLSEAVAEFHREFPRADITLRDLRYHDQLAALRARKAHLGFVMRGVLGRRDDLETQLVMRTRIAAVLPSRHPLAAGSELRLAELAHETWITLEEKEAPGYRAFITQLCRISGFTPRFGQTATTVEGLFGRVAAGYGIAVTLENNAPKNHPMLRVLGTDCEPLELCAVWPRKEGSPLLRGFLDIVRRHTANTAAAKPASVSPESVSPPAPAGMRRKPAVSARSKKPRRNTNSRPAA